MDTDYYKQYEPFFGSWKIVRLIGEGTYGKVFEICRSEYGIEEKAALKIISIPASKSEYNSVLTDCMDELSATEYFRNYMQEMIREISLMSKLKGNSYIVCYEDHEVKNRAETVGWDIMIRMELLTPLNEYTREKGTLGKDEVIHLGIDICKALEICQKYDIIHRDIKPENIFVADYGNFKLGDFGIARIASQTSGASTRAGTNAYMAPEIYRGEHYGKTVDLYSLGLVLYRLLNDNRLPFMPQYPAPLRFQDRENAQAMRLSGAPIPAPAHADPTLANVIAKACAYNAGDRFATATDMRLALESVLQPEKTVSDTVHIASGSPQPSSNATPNPYSEASNESAEATISRFANSNTIAAQQEDEDKTVSRFADAVAPKSTISLSQQKEHQSSAPVSDEKSETSKKGRKARVSTKVKLSAAIILACVGVIVYYAYSGNKVEVAPESQLESTGAKQDFVTESEPVRLSTVEIIDEYYTPGHWTETFGYATSTDTEWNTLQIDGVDSSSCNRIERTFDENGNVNQVTATFGDGSTTVYDVSFETIDTSQNVYITGENANGTLKIIYSMEQNSDGSILNASTSVEYPDIPDSLVQQSCAVVLNETGYIKEIRGDDYVLAFRQPNESNLDIYNITGSSGTSATLTFSPVVGYSAWEKMGVTDYYNGGQTKGTVLYCGNRDRILASNSISNYIDSIALNLDSILAAVSDPFGIMEFLDIESYSVEGQLTYLSFDTAANPTVLIAKQDDSKKYEIDWTYEKIGEDTVATSDSQVDDTAINSDEAVTVMGTEYNVEETTVINADTIHSQAGGGTSVTQEDITNIGKLTNLTELTITWRDLSSRDLSPLANLIKLEKLTIRCPNSKNQQLDFLQNLTSLHGLKMSDVYMETVPSLSASASMTSLELSRDGIVDASALKKVTSLETLNLCDNKIEDISFLWSMHKLKELDISKNNIQDVYVLLSLPTLEVLKIDTLGNKNTSALNILQAMPNLRYLRLADGTCYSTRQEVAEYMQSLQSQSLQ